MKVFISHSYEDQHLARALAGRLEDLGHEVFDPFTLALGTQFAAAATSAIQRADVVVALLRTTTPNLLYELGVAQGAHRPLIIASSGLSDLPFDLTSLPYVHLGDDIEGDAAEIARRIASFAPMRPHRFDVSGDTVETLKAIAEDSEFAASVSSKDFEELLVGFLRRSGLTVEQGRPDRDVFDFALTEPGHHSVSDLVIVEVKKYSSTSRVSVDAVLQLAGAVTSAGARLGILISTSGFTAAARGLAETVPISLWTLREILEMNTPRDLLRRGIRHSP